MPYAQLTPNQLAERFKQLAAEWSKLARQEIGFTMISKPPSYHHSLDYISWVQGVFSWPNVADVILQADTLKRYDEYKAQYAQDWLRLRDMMGKNPAAANPGSFGPATGNGFFGFSIPNLTEMLKWVAIPMGIFVGYKIYKDLR